MFERFTDRARRVVVLAQEESRLLGHNYIGTEHLLLGLIHEGEGVAAMALESLGVSLAGARARVEQIVGHGSDAPAGHIPFTPRAKKVLELSLREALQLGHNYIGTEHILLGILREARGVAAQVLVGEGADLETVRAAVVQLMSGMPLDELGARSFGDPAGSSAGFVQVVRSTAGASTPGPVSGFGVRPGGARCSFCLRTVDHVERYVRGRDALICDACVTRAQDLVAGAGAESPKRLRMPGPFLPQIQTPEAEESVVHAFETVFGNEAPVDARLELIERSENLRDVVSQLVGTARRFGNPDIWVDAVRFIALDEADVDYAALLSGGGRMPLHGFAVLDAGTWKVSRATYEQMASMSGLAVPPLDPRPDPPGE